jgi:hypothetical protein
MVLNRKIDECDNNASIIIDYFCRNFRYRVRPRVLTFGHQPNGVLYVVLVPSDQQSDLSGCVLRHTTAHGTGTMVCTQEQQDILHRS